MHSHAYQRVLQIVAYLNFKFIRPVSCPEDTGAQPRICGSPILQEMHPQGLGLSRNNRHPLVYIHAGQGNSHIQVHLIMHLTTDDCIPDEPAINPQACVSEQLAGQCHHGPQLATAKLLHDGCTSGLLQCNQKVSTSEVKAE